MKKRLVGTLMAFAVVSLGITAFARAGDDPPTAHQPKELILDCGKGASMKLVLIPAGEFLMGGDEKPEQVARKVHGVEAKAEEFQNEQPQHRVKITKPFYMGVYVVTQAQYEAVMGENPSSFKGESNPVDTVSWKDAVEFCKKLSAKTGQTVRLPTEAEWEYACRAGTTTPFNTGETISTDQANYDGNITYGTGGKGEYRMKTVAVGSFAPNGWGLYDMHGNVWEWCQDWFDAGYYKNSPTDDPQGPEKGGMRVLRGGSCYGPVVCRSALRGMDEPVDRYNSHGFRAVCAPSALLLALPRTASAADAVAVVTTTDGRKFTNVTVRRVEGDTVLLFHSEGAAKVPLSVLSDETRKSLGLRTRAEQAAFDANEATFEAEQAKKGLVKDGDKWLTPEEQFLKTPAGLLFLMHPDWGREKCRTITDGKIQIGMTAQQVKEAWGPPERVDTIISSRGKGETWWYNGAENCVTFDNGVVSYIQNSK